MVRSICGHQWPTYSRRPRWMVFIRPLSYATVLETYTFSDIFELNDVTDEEALEYLVTQGFVKLPEITPLEFND